MREDKLILLNKELTMDEVNELIGEDHEEALQQVSNIILDAKNKVISKNYINNIVQVFTVIFADYDIASRSTFIEFWKEFDYRDNVKKAIIELLTISTDRDTFNFGIAACYSVILHASYEIYGGEDLIDNLAEAAKNENPDVYKTVLRVLIEIFDSNLDVDSHPEQYQKLIEVALVSANLILEKCKSKKIIGLALKAAGVINPMPLVNAGKLPFVKKQLLTLVAKFHECIKSDNQKLVKKSYKLAKLLTTYSELGYKEEIFHTIHKILTSNPPGTEASVIECMRFVGTEGVRYKECKDRALKKLLIKCIEPILAKLRYEGENPNKEDEKGSISEMASKTLEILSGSIKDTHVLADIFFNENRANTEWQMRYAAVAAKNACVHPQRVTIDDSINLQPLLKDPSKAVRNEVISLIANELLTHDDFLSGISTESLIPIVVELTKSDDVFSLEQGWQMAYSMPSDLEDYAMEMLEPLCEVMKKRESMKYSFVEGNIPFFANKFIMLVSYESIKGVVPMLRDCFKAIDGYDLSERKPLQSKILQMMFSVTWSFGIDDEEGAIDETISYMQGLLESHPEHRWRIIIGMSYISLANEEAFGGAWPYLKEIVNNLSMECIDEVLTVLQYAVTNECMMEGAPTLKELSVNLSKFVRDKLSFPSLDKALAILGKALKRDLDGEIFKEIDIDLKLFSDHITQTLIGDKNTTMCALCYLNGAVINTNIGNRSFLQENAKRLMEPFFLVELSDLATRDMNRYLSGIKLIFAAEDVKEVKEQLLKKKIRAAIHSVIEESNDNIQSKAKKILKKLNALRDSTA